MVRIANALGDVGYLFLITATQNLIVLGILSRFVSPSVAAFCAYAAIALVFDVAFQLTFLVAVISVDVRRIELQDSLNNVAAQRQFLGSDPGVSWMMVFDLFKNNFQFHSRIAATSIVVSFIILVDSHFMDRRLGCWFGLCRPSPLSQMITSQLVESVDTPATVNRIDSLHDWVMKLRFSRVSSAVESIHLVNNRVLTRIYDPVIAVLADADRSIPSSERLAFITGPLQIIRRHIVPFTITLIVTMILLTFLMKFLLWNDSSDDDLNGNPMHNMLSVQAGFPCHSLDIEALYSSRKGHFISIALNRSIYLHIYDSSSGCFRCIPFPISMDRTSLWPLKTIAIDDSGRWVAAYTDTGSIFIWAVQARRFQRRVDVVSPECRPPEMSAFQFLTTGPGDRGDTSLVYLTKTGLISHIDVDLPVHDQPVQISDHPVTSSNFVVLPSGEIQLSFATSNGQVRTFTRRDTGAWDATFSTRPRSRSKEVDVPHAPPLKQPIAIVGPLSVVAGVTSDDKAISVSKSTDCHEIFSLPLGNDESVSPSSVRVLHTSPRACPHCGSVAVHTFTIVYDVVSGSECVMHTFSARLQEDQDFVCLGVPSGRNGSTGSPKGSSRGRRRGVSCLSLADSVHSVHRVVRPGVWEATRSQSIIGIRRRPIEQSSLLIPHSRRSSLSLKPASSSSILSCSSSSSAAAATAAAAASPSSAIPSSIHNRSPFQPKPRLRIAARRLKQGDVLSSTSTSTFPSSPASSSSHISPLPLDLTSPFSSPFPSVTRRRSTATSKPDTSSSSSSSTSSLGVWEVFSLSASGEFSSVPLVDPTEPDLGPPNKLFRVMPPLPEELPFVSTVSALTPIGDRSVAIGFGSRVWLVTLGPAERFDEPVFGMPESGRLDGAGGMMIATWGRNRGARRST